MRTSPLIQATWTLLGAVILAIPLYHLTKPARSSPLPSTREQTERTGQIVGHTTCVMTVKCAHKPQSVTISHHGRIIHASKGASDSTEWEDDITLPLLQSPVTLHVEAIWSPDGGPDADTPLTLTIEPEGYTARTVTRWSQGSILNDIYSFSW